VLTITSPSNQDEEIENMVRELFPRMKKTYHIISGTPKFEMSKKRVKISIVFDLMERAKSKIDSKLFETQKNLIMFNSKFNIIR
jgi:hypothetical protein